MSNLPEKPNTDPKSYGLEEVKAAQIREAIQPMLDKQVELEERYNAIITKERSDEVILEAKELLKIYVNIRIATKEEHKKLKDFYLKGGRFVDALKNTQLFMAQGKEEALKEIVDHKKNQAIEAKKKLQEEREQLLRNLEVDIIPQSLGDMEEDVWGHYLSGTEAAFKTRKEAEAKAEEERIEKERLDILENQRKYKTSRLADHIDGYDNLDFRNMEEPTYLKLVEDAISVREKKEKEQEKIRLQNEKLKKKLKAEQDKADAKEKLVKERTEELRPYIVFIRDYNGLINSTKAQYSKELAEIKTAAKQQWEYDREQEEIRIKNDQDLKDKEAAKQAEIEKQKEAERQAASAPDREKVQNFLLRISNIPVPGIYDPECLEIIKLMDESTEKANNMLSKLLNEVAG